MSKSLLKVDHICWSFDQGQYFLLTDNFPSQFWENINFIPICPNCPSNSPTKLWLHCDPPVNTQNLEFSQNMFLDPPIWIETMKMTFFHSK